MPQERDVQTVSPDGALLRPLPDGVVLRDLVTHTDDRGTVVELLDDRWPETDDPIVFTYCFTIRPGAAKGWAVHREHEDRYTFIDGEMEVALYDGREDSPTHGLEAHVVLSGRRRQLLVIPRGVWHAERNLGDRDVLCMNHPTIRYDHASPDKYRLPLDTDELPVCLGPGWTGW